MKFTRSKFFKLDSFAQHKKCAELLRLIYEAILCKKEYEDFLSHYNQLQNWLGLDSLEDLSLKKMADRYHYHLEKAQVNLKEHNLLPSLRTGDRSALEEFAKNAIYLDNIRSAYNVGSILRTTEALRIGSVYFTSKTPFIDNPKVIKTAMGAAEIVPCLQNEKLENLPRPLIALDTSESAIPLYEFIFPKNFTLILGNEEYGISDEALKMADYILEIPMRGCKNSINVACAYSIAAAQIKRQQNFSEILKTSSLEET